MMLAGALIAIPGSAADADVTACPTALPTAEAVDGLVGTGYTVERGTTADPFTAQVLGRITDGIAPGIDMIMADLSSPALTRAGGVWAGMSGSPVYTSDGKLIGSVSYGLAASSPIAGITPAAEMLKLLSTSPTALKTPTKIAVSSSTAKRLARTGSVTATVADDGFVQLKVPVSVSGATGRSTKFLKHLGTIPGVLVRSGGASAPAAAAAPSEITAGSNFAAALSYGDVSAIGTGTTTFVCNGEAVAFGHPMLSGGDVEFTAHPASAIYIQEDPTWGPFKVANPGGPVGVVSKDGTTGIRATLGATPTSAYPITSSLVTPSGATVTGSTTGVYQPYAPDIAAIHLQSNVIKALGADGGGSAALTYTITGTRAAGKKFSLTRSDHYADSQYISYAAADDLYSTLYELTDQSFEDVKITGVKITGTVSSKIKQYRVVSVSMPKGKSWVPQKGTIVTRPGKTVTRRLTLAPYRSTKRVNTVIKIKIPAKTKGATGSLTLSDGYSGWYDYSEPKSFSGLLKQIASAPGNDSIVATLNLDTGRKQWTTTTTTKVNGPVSEFARDLSIRIK